MFNTPANIMETTQPLGYEEQRISRRDLLIATRNILGAVAIATVCKKLSEGVAFNKPELLIELIANQRNEHTVHKLNHGADVEQQLSVTGDGRLLFEPSGQFFTDEREFTYIHRSGNSIESIYEAHRMGANLFDIDVNNVGGIIYGEHGLVPQINARLGRFSLRVALPIVIDIHEKEIILDKPKHTYESLVACAASLSTEENPLAISSELKRGNFDPETIEKLLRIHQVYNVPVIMHSPDTTWISKIAAERL